MENASKALIIAGAILLAIVLISLGMFILGQGQDIVKNNGMNQAQITALNSKFTKYEGEQKGSVIKTMMSEVRAANADANNKDAGVNITVDSTVSDATGTNITNTSGFLTTKTYSVTVEYGSNGIVNKITIRGQEII